MNMTGVIQCALSGFYDVYAQGTLTRCRARGRFRHEKLIPLVGDRVEFTPLGGGMGSLDAVLPRKNAFRRPAVANMDQMVIVASAAIPITDPFLIDRVSALAECRDCLPVICVNKCDLEPGDALADIYRQVGYPTFAVSAATGEGLPALARQLAGRVSVFTGNSGVGKSSLLNALGRELSIATGEVSKKLGRGRHTTRHVELFRLGEDALAADTPGFAAFDAQEELGQPEELENAFREFAPYLGGCRFTGCAHVKEQGCAVLEAVQAGEIPMSRHQSYVRLYEAAKAVRPWERNGRSK